MYKIMLKKRFAATIFIITILVAYTPKRDVPNFSGKWHAETSSMSFDLSIYQKENVLSGSHCSVMNNGDKIDCVITESDLSLSGIVGDSLTLLVTFKSQASLKTGTAKISKLDDTTIRWRIINKPNGVFYIPEEITLKKEKVLGLVK